MLVLEKGWQSENIARYILSNFAFISQPSTIADDLGSDFFVPYLTLLLMATITSFYLKNLCYSNKSNRKPFYITGKTEYLKSLGIPFLLVFVIKSQELEFYSGEYLIPFLLMNHQQKKLKSNYVTQMTVKKIVMPKMIMNLL